VGGTVKRKKKKGRRKGEIIKNKKKQSNRDTLKKGGKRFRNKIFHRGVHKPLTKELSQSKTNQNLAYKDRRKRKHHSLLPSLGHTLEESKNTVRVKWKRDSP